MRATCFLGVCQCCARERCSDSPSVFSFDSPQVAKGRCGLAGPNIGLRRARFCRKLPPRHHLRDAVGQYTQRHISDEKSAMQTNQTNEASPEHARLQEDREGRAAWKKWGPYLSERQWGTVREDYSSNGDAWNYFSHDNAQYRAYRWGEDGLAGISDDRQLLCFALALWNGRDPILKERLFGLNNSEGRPTTFYRPKHASMRRRKSSDEPAPATTRAADIRPWCSRGTRRQACGTRSPAHAATPRHVPAHAPAAWPSRAPLPRRPAR
jgi:hypothetical protein